MLKGLDIREKEQHDGSKWKEYTTSSGISLTVTGAFQDLMKAVQPNVLNDDKEVAKRLLRILHSYREAFEDGYYDDVRTFIIKGGEAEFFGLGETHIGIREVLDDSEDQTRNIRNLKKMTKMDIIKHLLDLGSIPRWIKTPTHYAMLNLPKTNERPSRNFVMMDKVDSGVTVQDIISPRDNLMRKYILREFGEYYKFTTLEDSNYISFQNEVKQQYDDLVVRLRGAFLENKTQLPPGLKFEDIFTDLFERNVVITHNEAPIGGSKISFWIIDQ